MGGARYQDKTSRRSPSSHSHQAKHRKSPSRNSEDVWPARKQTSPMPVPDSKRENRYAGPKFSSPPSADLLPKPPNTWISCHKETSDGPNLDAMTVHLRRMLKMSTA
eukprot:gene12060-2651_t